MNIQSFAPEKHSTQMPALTGEFQGFMIGKVTDKCRRWLALLLMTCWLLSSLRVHGGTWSALANPPPGGVNNALLLSDGTVIFGDGGQNWYRLTPDIHGSYVNGTWIQTASTSYTRLFYSSQVLTNGNVYVAGGEDGTGTAHAELYDTLANNWSVISQPSGASYSDANSKMLPSGNVLEATVGHAVYIYNTAQNVIVTGPSATGSQDEACWVRLPNDNVLTVDFASQNSEHYVPSLNEWVTDGNLPVAVYGYGEELGAAFVLPNGKVFQLGATPHTAIYTPGNNLTAAGSWVTGADIPNSLGQVDAPAAMMANGKILCAVGSTNGFNGPTSFYEYDYSADSFTQVNGPTGITYNNGPFASTMLDLPDGNVLFIGGQGTTSIYVYSPGGSPLAAGIPTISSITENADGSYHLAGVGLNGITGGAAYGDDWQMDTSYPLVRMTNNASGNVYYARTYNWSSTTIQNPNPVTTEFTLPPNMAAGTYSLVLTANGNASAPTTFTYSPLAAPLGFSAVIGNSQLGLSWNSVSNATAYNVFRSTNSGAYYVKVATINTLNYTDTGLLNGANYFYLVTAVGNGGPSAYSAELVAAPVGSPAVPTGLTAIADGNQRVDLTWNATLGATSYNLKRSPITGGGFTTIASPGGARYTDTNAVSGTAYYYVVSAVGPNGESGNSSQVTGGATLPPPWITSDIGAVGTVGSATYLNGTFTLKGSGADIWVAPDEFRYVYYAVTNNGPATSGCQLIARVATLQNTDGSAKAGVMIRETLDPSSAFAMVNVKPGSNGFEFITRTNGGSPVQNGGDNGSVPQWVEITRTNNAFNAYYSANSSSWTAMGGAVVIPMNNVFYVGLLVCSHNDGVICTATLDNVSLSGIAVPTIPAVPSSLSTVPGNGQATLSWSQSTGATTYSLKRSTTSGSGYTTVVSLFAGGTNGISYTDSGLAAGTTYYYVVTAVNGSFESGNSSQVSALPTGPLPSPWLSSDIGNVGVTGSAGYAGGTFSVNGGGADIWNTADAFRYVYQSVVGNCDLRARVASVVQPTSGSAKASVMIREKLAANSRQAMMDVESSGAPEFILRSTTGGSSTDIANGSGSPPFWVRMTRTNNIFTAYQSANGFLWSQVGTPQTIAMSNMFYVGLAVCAHDNSTIAKATIDNVSALWNNAPTALSGTASDSQVSLTWNLSAGATSYNLKRSLSNGGPYTTILSTTGTNFTDIGLTNGTIYYYLVSSVGGGGEIASSSQVSAMPLPPPPVVLAVGSFNAGQFGFSFQGQTNHNYVVQTSTNLTVWYTVQTNASANGLFIYTNFNPTDAVRFYRVSQ
ncbi:MAG TPA: hypothetical protein VG347_20105 [Verrucomicrobiae bacterium]|nr:hypothetical protein [Verrucomicrobiae bacterium]